MAEFDSIREVLTVNVVEYDRLTKFAGYDIIIKSSRETGKSVRLWDKA